MTTTNDAPAPAPSGSGVREALSVEERLLERTAQVAELFNENRQLRAARCGGRWKALFETAHAALVCIAEAQADALYARKVADELTVASLASDATPAPTSGPEDGGGVRVKALEWIATAWNHRAADLYVIEDMGSNWTVDRFWLAVHGLTDNVRLGKFAALDEAKAAAQSDYEARILSALASDATPAPTSGSEDGGEAIAKIVYAAMKWAAERTENGKPPEWVERGNSLAQTEARRFATDIASLFPTATPVSEAGEALARRFHDIYERLAPSFGYETRKDTRQFDPTTPNGRLMIAVCSEIATALARPASDDDGLVPLGREFTEVYDANARELYESKPAPEPAGGDVREALEKLYAGGVACHDLWFFKELKQIIAALSSSAGPAGSVVSVRFSDAREPEIISWRMMPKGEHALYAHPAPATADMLDDLAVDRFAAAMKEKLAKKRAEGRGGWEDKDDCSNAFLSQLLREHVDKGDPVDVGNLAMMIHQRSERIG